MKKVLYSILLLSIFIIIGCEDLDNPKNEIINGGEVIVDIDGVTFKNILLQSGTIKKEDNRTVYGYKAYKISYITLDEEGNEVNASGLMSVPQGLGEAVEKQLGFSVVSDDHGTIFAELEAPTSSSQISYFPSGSSVILTSFAGFVTLQPDYIGFGDSKDHYHPFILKKSLANATVDFIKAARNFAQKNGIKLNNQLFLTGYSEGGYASLATLEKIELDENLKETLKVTMTAPMAGPYAVDVMGLEVVKAEKLTVPSFMANIVYAYAQAYEQDISNLVNEPYASKLEGLFNGELSRIFIDLELTQTITGENGLFTTTFVNGMTTDQNHWFRRKMRENDIYKFVPKSAVRLIHCKGDDVIPYAISELTEATMKAQKAPNIALVPVEITVTQDINTTVSYGHAECASKAYGIASQLFAVERKKEIGY